MLYTHILIPTDFSPAANHALGIAFEEAAQHQTELTMLHIMQHHAATEVYYIKGAPENQFGFESEIGGTLPSPQIAHPEMIRRDHNEEALAQLRDLVPDSFTRPWHVQVAIGDPADAIVRIAQEIGADLIVMGTHGRTGLQHVFLGSVAEKVVRHSPCPVLTVRDREHAT
jgi:nucleotide-binding universal stress UspA family protein